LADAGQEPGFQADRAFPSRGGAGPDRGRDPRL